MNHKNPLRSVIDESKVESYRLDEFLALPEGEKQFVWLINDYLKSYFWHLGLIVDRKKKRVYFPRTEQGERVITYKARFKKATRTLVRPRYAADKERVRYWEHKAFYYSVKRLGNQWGLLIEPSYVFTLNGERVLLASERVGRLATKKASRDYNISVLNDIIFWAYRLANGSTEAFSLQVDSNLSLSDEMILSTEYLAASLNYVENIEDVDLNNDEVVEDSELEEELARLADLEREGRLSGQ